MSHLGYLLKREHLAKAMRQAACYLHVSPHLRQRPFSDAYSALQAFQGEKDSGQRIERHHSRQDLPWRHFLFLAWRELHLASRTTSAAS